MDKVVASAEEAVADIPDGATVGVSGFGASHGFPAELIAACADRADLSDLTLVCNSLGVTDAHPGRFVRRGRVRRLIASFSARAGIADSSAAKLSPVDLDVELVPQGVLVERLRAAGAGLGPFFSPVGVDTVLAVGKERRDVDGRSFVLEYPLHLDYALVYAAMADRAGNVAFRGTSENFGPSFAKAARNVIVQVDEICEVGTLAPDRIDLPGVFVDRVVKAAQPRQPTWRRKRDDNERREYAGRLGWSPVEIGARIASLLPDGSYVNLGVGLPTQVSDHLKGRDVILHSENGALGYTDRVAFERADPDAFNAGGEPITLGPGASTFDSIRAFEIARGGHLTAVILGAFQVEPSGSFSNWTNPVMGGGAIGGSMDLIVDPGKLIIAMRHTERNGKPKLVPTCEYPYTGQGIVDLIVTDICVIERDEHGFVLRETAPGFTADDVVAHTAAPLRVDLW